MRVLVWMHLQSLKTTKNSYKLKNCLTVADFAGNSGDIAVVKKDKDMDALRVAAANVRSPVSKHKLEWEGGPKRGDIAKETDYEITEGYQECSTSDRKYQS